TRLHRPDDMLLTSTRAVFLAAIAWFPLLAQPAQQSGDIVKVIERYGLEESPTPVRDRPAWRKPRRILVGGFGAQLLPDLRSLAPDIEFIAAKPDEIAKQAADVDAVIGLCTPEILAVGKSIQWIQLLSAGVEHCVSIPAVRERNILLTNMQRIDAPIIAEHALAMALAFTRGLDLYISAQRNRQWRRVAPPGRMSVVDGKTILIVGLGGIGTETARRANALGMRVIATRASGRTGPSFVSYVGSPEELLKLASEADYIVNTAPLTQRTAGMFNAEFFARMKTSAYFINVARGGSVAATALVDALIHGKIAGAGLDVADPEPLPEDHPLWSAPNVIITPHVANDSDLGFDAQVAVTKENLRRYSNGERMLSVVDLSRGY
ncbi:MAG TPA: D-2-hydroxyacid dehydrogenase, partial [Steroidobacter sp.]|nr:D-2-hydroxyacid dehydrogenase [Steroidobacter sp.]